MIQELTILNGHVLSALATIPNDTVDLIVTSPPYWGLRDYGEETIAIWDGDAECEHEWGALERGHHIGQVPQTKDQVASGSKDSGAFCSKCGAWHGQLGLEPSLELYTKHLLQITAELKRVLKPTGVLFWNHGDSYSASGERDVSRWSSKEIASRPPIREKTLPAKCLCLQNYRLILRMIDEQGWILRNAVIWNKTNHMPSSVKDRFTNGYEPIFMLTKSKRYWFDLDAVREPHKYLESEQKRQDFTDKVHYGGQDIEMRGKNRYARSRIDDFNPLGKNPGDVWTMNTQPFPDAHFAVFPEELPERCIKCGCPREICTQCGKARVRITERDSPDEHIRRLDQDRKIRGAGFEYVEGLGGQRHQDWLNSHPQQTIGWTTCSCANPEYRPGIVLDPFLGSGTTMKVARRLGMSCIGIEISPKYVAMAKREVGWNEGLFGIEFREFLL